MPTQPATLVLATRNAGKLKEIAELLAAHGSTRALDLKLVGDFTDVEPVEDGGTYLANATIKAKAALAASALPSLADDAGLELDGLPDEYGVESAPFAAAHGGWPQAMAAIAERIAAGASDRARHHVTYVLCRPDGTTEAVEAVVPGRIVYPARGDDWGFNPYFLPDGQDLTYAEIKARHGLAAKNALSARGLALTRMIAKLGL